MEERAIRRIEVGGKNCKVGIMIRRVHIYIFFGVALLGMTAGIRVLLAGAKTDADLSHTLLLVISTASGITLAVACALFFAAWNVRHAPD